MARVILRKEAQNSYTENVFYIKIHDETPEKSYMAFVGIILLRHETVAVFDVLKCLAGESTETNQVVFNWLKLYITITYNVFYVLAIKTNNL